MGVANDRSIAWGIARVLHGQGAELAFSYQGGAFGRRAVPLAQSIGAPIIEEADVEDLESVKRVFEVIRKKWGSLDFVVHALAFSDRNELKGRYCDTTRANFEHTMVISCFSFTEIAKLASELMPNGRLAAHAHVWRLDPRRSLLQRHGRGQGCPRGERALSRHRFRAARGQGERAVGRDRCARSPAPASRTRARCSTISSAMRRCIARRRSDEVEVLRSISFRICPAR
jgi:NAD(P)-dependent dehydrogenase (short-subunit alcohol dehydrogenase family)